MRKRSLLLSVSLTLLLACEPKKSAPAPQPPRATTHAGQQPTPRRGPIHPAEQAAVQLLTEIRTGQYDQTPYPFVADAKIPAPERAVLFHALTRYIKAHQWQLWYTEVGVYQGIDDDATIYFRSPDGNFLVLLAGYEYAPKQWQVGAYEFPEMSFKHPEGQSFPAYAEQSVEKSRRRAVPAAERSTIEKDGAFYLE